MTKKKTLSWQSVFQAKYDQIWQGYLNLYRIIHVLKESWKIFLKLLQEQLKFSNGS